MIRNLMTSDVPTIVFMLHDVANESGWTNRVEFSPRHIAPHLGSLINRDDTLTIGVENEKKELAGLLIGEIGDTWFTPSLIAHERFFYVRPEDRRNGYAESLIKHYKQWAQGRGAKDIWVGNGLGIQPEGVRKLLEKQDFVPIGYLFKKGA